MAKITALPQLAGEAIDGAELVPVAKGGRTYGAPIEYLGRAAARDAELFVAAARAFANYRPTKAAAEAAFPNSGALISYLAADGFLTFAERKAEGSLPLPASAQPATRSMFSTRSFDVLRSGKTIVERGVAAIETSGFAAGAPAGGARYIRDDEALGSILGGNLLNAPDDLTDPYWNDTNTNASRIKLSDGYTRLSDTDANGRQQILSQFGAGPGVYTAAVCVRKDQVASSTREMAFSLYTIPSSGVLSDGERWTVGLDTKSGAIRVITNRKESPVEAVVEDFGSEWLVRITGTASSDNKQLRWEINPAAYQAGSTGSNVSLTGSVDVRRAVLVKSTWAAANVPILDIEPTTTFAVPDETGTRRGWRLSPWQSLTPEMFGAIGDGVTDDTLAFAALSRFVNATAATEVHLHAGATYRIGRWAESEGVLRTMVSPFKFSRVSGLRLIGNGATIKANDGYRFGAFDPATMQPMGARQTSGTYSCEFGHLLELERCKDFFVSDLTLDGNQGTAIIGAEWGDTGRQGRGDGVRVYYSNGRMERVTAKECPRDGLYLWGIGCKRPSLTSTDRDNSVFEGCRFTRNGRQALSLVGGRGIKFVTCEFSETSQGKISSAPRAGVDIEPNSGFWVDDVDFDNCEFTNNVGAGLLFGTTLWNNIRVTGGTIWAGFAEIADVTKGSGDAIYYRESYDPRLRFTVRNVSIHGATATGQDEAEHINCLFDDAVHPIYGRAGINRGILLANCQGRYRQCVFNVTGGPIRWMDPKGGQRVILDGCSFRYAGTLAGGSSIFGRSSTVTFTGRNTMTVLNNPATFYFADMLSSNMNAHERSGILYLSGGIYFDTANKLTGYIANNTPAN